VTPSRKGFWAPLQTALNGVVYTVKTQRHMRFHLFVVFVVLLIGIYFNLRVSQMLILIFTIGLVLVAEMFNSAIEATVDLIEPRYHPLAKFAKDISAGAVLVASTIAIVVGSLLLIGDTRFEDIRLSLTTGTFGLPEVPRILIGIVLVAVAVIIGKGLGKQGEVFKGGLVSGHAAFGFFFAVLIALATNSPVIAMLALTLAFIIAQSRWEAKIHTAYELALGALVGTVVAYLIFNVFRL
jgi:diacylglycerol kinase (ATP)